METTSSFWPACVALVAAAICIPGLAGLFEIRAALREGDLQYCLLPRQWHFVRAAAGIVAALPVYLCSGSLGPAALLAALCAAGLGYALAPQLLAEARSRTARAMLDDSVLLLELMALVLESGGSLTSALSAAAERAPAGPLRCAVARAVREIFAGVEVHDALRALDQRLGLRPLSLLVTTLRNAERSGFDIAALVRDRARQAATARFARADRLARAAPLKLWATMLLCIAPCTMLVLAWPLARLLALAVDG